MRVCPKCLTPMYPSHITTISGWYCIECYKVYREFDIPILNTVVSEPSPNGTWRPSATTPTPILPLRHFTCPHCAAVDEVNYESDVTEYGSVDLNWGDRECNDSSTNTTTYSCDSCGESLDTDAVRAVIRWNEEHAHS